MPRVTTVAAARKEQGSCGFCGKIIEVGQGYRWFKFRYGGKRVRHSACPNFRASDLTQAKYGQVYAAIEAAEDALAQLSMGGFDTTDDIRSVLEDCATEATAVGEEYEESASNMESAFQGGSYKIDEIRESAEACTDFADHLTSAGADIEEWSESDAEDEAREELTTGEEPVDEDELADAVQDKLIEWQHNAIEVASDALGEFQL